MALEDELLAMLAAAETKDGVTFFEHSAAEIGIAVMDSHPAVLAALTAIGPRAGEVERAIELTFGEAERIIRSFVAIGDHNRESVITTMRRERGAAYILKALAHTPEAGQ